MTTLEKIRAEIRKVLDAERNFTSESAKAQAMALFWVLELIDKYAEQEPCDTISYNDDFATALQKISKYEDKMAKMASEDAVSRQAVLDVIDKMGLARTDAGRVLMLEESIEKLPSVQPKKTGRWIALESRFELGDRVKCSECGQVFVVGDDVSRNYCPNCGCRMVEPQKREVSNADSN